MEQYTSSTIFAELSGPLSNTAKFTVSSLVAGSFASVNLTFFSQYDVPEYGRIEFKLVGAKKFSPGYGLQTTTAPATINPWSSHRDFRILGEWDQDLWSVRAKYGRL